MRKLRAYTWEKVLDEEYVRTQIGLGYIQREINEEKKAADKAGRKR